MKKILTKRFGHRLLLLPFAAIVLALGAAHCPAQESQYHPFSSSATTTPSQPPVLTTSPPSTPGTYSVFIPATEALQPPEKTYFDDWNLAKPDYSPLAGKGYDPHLEMVLEQMRFSINAMKDEIVQSKEFLPQHQSPQYQMLMEPLAVYVQLLRNTGLDMAAESVLDAVPKSYDSNQPVFDIRSQLQSMASRSMSSATPQKPGVQQIASILQNAHPDKDGYFNYSSRPQVMQTGLGVYYPPAMAYSMPEEDSDPDAKDDKRIREKSYSAFARALIALEQPDLDEVLQWNKQLTQNDGMSFGYNHQGQLSCAILLSAMGEQDIANQLVDRVLLDATKYAQNQNEQNRNHQVQAEGVVIRDQNVWQTFIGALLRMGEYDTAVKMLREMRENMTKLQAAGENIYWNSNWNSLSGNLATFAALEGDLDRALEYAKLPVNPNEKQNLLQSIAMKLFRQGRMDEMKRVTDSENYVQSSGNSFNDPNARYNQAKEIAKTGSRDEALAALCALFEPDENNNPGIPYDPAMRNELGLLFLKWDDGINARKLFTMVNDAIKSTLQQQSRQDSMFGQGDMFAKFLAARYKAGLTGETLDFVKTIKQAPGCIMFHLTLAEEIANESNQADVLELLNLAWQAALTQEPNPGIPEINDPYRGGGSNRFIFRNDFLWAVARAALVANCLPEAERYIQEARALDANIPKISVKVRMMLNSNSYYQPFQASQQDQLWMSCVDKILKRNRNNIGAAMIAAGNIESPHARHNAFVRISQVMLKGEGANKGVSQTPSYNVMPATNMVPVAIPRYPVQ